MIKIFKYHSFQSVLVTLFQSQYCWAFSYFRIEHNTRQMYRDTFLIQPKYQVYQAILFQFHESIRIIGRYFFLIPIPKKSIN